MNNLISSGNSSSSSNGATLREDEGASYSSSLSGGIHVAKGPITLDSIRSQSQIPRKVIPSVVVSPDGISSKLLPSRKATNALHSKHRPGTKVTIYARRIVKEKLKESPWILTNVGWVAERSYGHATIKTSVHITAKLQPLRIRVLGANFVEAPTPFSMFDKKKDFQTMFTIECTYPSSLEEPEFKNDGAWDSLDEGSSACYNILGLEYTETPIIKLSRSYSDFYAFYQTVDLHHSALGVKFPDDYIDGDESILCDVENNVLFNIVDSIDKWMQTIIKKYNVNENISLQNFLDPNDGIYDK